MFLSKLIPSLLVAALAIGITTAPAEAQNVGAGANVVIDDINFNPADLVFDPATGLLTIAEGTISGTLAGLPFTTNFTDLVLDVLPDAEGTCAILDLELGPIDIDLLGVHVDTSPICLNIAAIEGGGLLGDLLCDLADGLNLGELDLESLVAILSEVLGGTLTESLAQSQTSNGSAGDICDGQCEILDLAIGPVDLTLLGLNVVLDDCEGGPVQVCVSASRGQGILGNLLCGLTNAQVLNLTLADIAQLAERAAALSADGNLSRRDIGQLTALLGRLVR